jgi:copper(I)-binding protein
VKFESPLWHRLAAGLLLLAVLPIASAIASDAVSVTHAWVRASVPGQSTTAAYMELASRRDARLVAVQTPAAGRTELHTMRMDGDVMRMRPVRSIELPAGTTVKLAPGGLHVMMMDLKQPLKAGDKIDLVLVIEAGGEKTTVRTEAEVRTGPPQASHHH